MRLKLTLQRRDSRTIDVVVTADTTATVQDVARRIIETDPARETIAGPDDVVTLTVAPPTSNDHVLLDPGTLISDAAVGSGFIATVVNLGPDHVPNRGGGGPAAAILHIVGGPLTGREIPLPKGHFTIGRAAGADVVLDEPLVSKRHARIEVGSGGVEVVDLNSANGIVVDGGLVPRLNVIPGQRFTLGDSDLVIQLVPDFAPVEKDPVLERGGALLFNRSPRVEPRYVGEELPEPRMPKEPMARLFPWPMLVAPILLGVTMYFVFNRPQALFIVAMTPMMMLGNFVSQRTQIGQRIRKEGEIFERGFEELEETLYRERPREREVRNAEVPPVAVVFEEAMKLGGMLWTRRPEHWNFLAVRLGTCVAPSRTTIKRADAPEALQEYVERVDRLRDRYRMIDDVPVLESLQSVGVIGVAGPDREAGDALRGICTQLFGLHSPNELVAIALTEPEWAKQLDWLTWLPHTSSERSPFRDMPLSDSASTGNALLSGLEELVMRRSRAASAPRLPYDDDWDPMRFGTDVRRAAEEATFPGQTAVLVIVTADAPVDRARLTQVLERGADVGVYGLFVAPVVEALPAVCRSFVDVSRGLDEAHVGVVRSGEDYTPAKVEGVSNDLMRVLAKRLAPVVDSSTVIEDSSDIPNSVMFLSLVGNETASDPAFAIERWRENNTIIDRSGATLPRLKKAGNLRAIVGQGATDAMTLDLRTQGPHALVGGTTGAGKSEFLQAWVLGMAAAHSPDRVTFLFVDYKGGSAFADCVELPHCVGLVTDLSPHLVRRALTSLRAELHYREHLFNRKKAKDLLELEKRRDPDTPPALVLVIDEFAALAGEVPEFVDGVVDIAQRGRSLGIHLIMATQRPAGVIKDNLRANTNLRVALRMADESDSKDVVDDPVAASFPPSIPGRGIAKTGPGRLIPFQSAYAGGWTTDEVVAADVSVAELRFGSIQRWELEDAGESDSHDVDPGPNDQKRIVSTLIAASNQAGIPAPRRPWLDDLPTNVDIRELPGGSRGAILLGKADIPERQLQEAVYFEPDRDGSLLVYGTSGSGKSTVLRTIAISAAMGRRTENVEVYGLDFGSGSLKSLETLPHVGSIIPGDDSERVQRIMRSLGAVLDERGKRFSAANASSIAEYREITGRDEARIVLLLDGLPQFRAEWESTTARMPFYQAFMRILGEGRPLGVHVVATADRSGSVPTAVSSNVSRRVILRLSDANAYALLNAPKDVLDERSEPGRAIVDGMETQIAVLGGTPNVAEQTKLLDQLAQELRARGAREVPEIGALPTRLDASDLPDRIGEFPALGVAEDTLAAREFDPVGTFIVAGPPQAGKTTALKSLILSMTRLDPSIKLFHFGGRRAQLKEFAPWMRTATTPDDAKELATELAELVLDETLGQRLMIVIEDVPQFADSPAERPLKALFQAINRSDHLLIGDADVNQVTSGFGLIGDFKGGRKGIILKPDAFDGDAVFKVPFPKIKRSDFPAGRGMFVQAGRAVVVQMPLVEAAALPAAEPANT
ncbi:FtsK/SpoIIIE domain-containing protein [Microbacterium sp. NPDC091382]|uniref:FtsK/SpoIIIE domain-containing protein n=1 Tax=Microbacterium sp. NPDC091382 TaxID=3364210 RepID=UPI00382B8F5F